MRSYIFGLAAFASVFAAIIAHAAEGDQGTDQIVHETRTLAEISDTQRTALLGQVGPRPGVYRLKPLHSGYCLGVTNAVAWPEKEHITQKECQGIATNFWVIPHPAGGYTIRTDEPIPQSTRAFTPDQKPYCATVARGVFFGAPRIDLYDCGLPAGAGDWAFAGLDDQRFDLKPVGPNNYEIRPVGNSNDCWAVRDASRGYLVDILRWNCHGGAEQHFNFEPVKPLPADIESSALQKSGWFPSPDGPRRRAAANGVNIPGGDYASFETIADGGDYCMKRCHELAQCKAWTWTAAGYAGNATPMCFWKSSVGQPVNKGRAFFNKIFSGVIRP